MRKILIMFLFYGFILNAQNVNNEITQLEKSRKGFVDKIDSLKDSIAQIDKKINLIKSKEILKAVKDSTLTAIVSKDAKLRKRPFPMDDIIYAFKEDKEVLILDYQDEYFGVCVDEVCGYVNELWVKRNQKVNDLINIRIKEKKELEKIKEENKLKKANKDYAAIEAKNVKKYGQALYSKLKKGMVWVGMTDDMLLIALGSPNEINRTVGRWGVHEQWVYEREYYYFENGIMTSYQD